MRDTLLPPPKHAELTQELAAKQQRLLDVLGQMQSCLVAFSGGLDSTVVAKAAQLALGSQAASSDRSKRQFSTGRIR